MKQLLWFGELELFSPTAEDKQAVAAVKRRSKIFVRAKFTQAGVKNRNGHKLLLEDIKEALPTLNNSYIKDTHSGPVVGTCYRAEIAEPENPKSLVFADYVVWRTKETAPFVERLLKAHADNSMGVSWETHFEREEPDPSDSSVLLRGIEFAGSAFTEIPAYLETLGFLGVAEARELSITGFCCASIDTDEAKEEREARARKYGISIRANGNAAKPAEWSSVPDEEWGDPVNYSYPCHDKEHVQAALHYWGMPRNRGMYSPEDQKIIEKRLARFAGKFGIKTQLEADLEEKIAQLELEKASLEKEVGELKAKLQETESSLREKTQEFEAYRASAEKEKLQKLRLEELGELAEKDKDYAVMAEAEFKIYKLEQENSRLKEQLASALKKTANLEALNIPQGTAPGKKDALAELTDLMKKI